MKKYSSLFIVGRGFGLSLFIVLYIAVLTACASSDKDDGNQPDGDAEEQAADGDRLYIPDGDAEEVAEVDTEETEAELDWGPIDPELDPFDLVLPPFESTEVEMPQGIRVRVVSYNVYGFNFADATTIGTMLAGLNPDMVALQEMPVEQVETLAVTAGMSYSYALDGKAILSRTALTDTSEIELYNGRSLLHANTVIGGVTFSFYAAHISWNVDGDLQCRQFIDEVLTADPVKHFIIAGDFNDEVYSTQIDILSKKLGDSYIAAGLYPGERITWPSTRFDDSEGSQMIDLILFRKDFAPIVTQTEVVNLAPVLSDHKPVMAELLFPAKDGEPFSTNPYAALRDIWRDFPPEGERPDNLLVNPSAEDGLTGWQTADGAVSVAARENQSALSGEGMFAGFAEYVEGTPHMSSAYQDVDLSAMSADIDASRVHLYVSGYMTTGYQTVTDGETVSSKPLPYDEGEIVVELLDANGVSIQQLYSKRRDTLDWHPFAAALDVAPGTRTARYSWIAHHKPNNGTSNDALFDDLYLGAAVLPDAHSRAGANLLINPGAELAEAGEDEEGNSIYTEPGWELSGWHVVPDRQVLAFYAPYPSLTFSGRYYFLGGDVDLVAEGQSGLSTLAQKIDLAAWRAQIADGDFALRWGGRLRTWAAENGVTISLEIYNYDGSLWARIPGDEIKAAEWTQVEYLTRIPAGTSAVRLLLEADVEERGLGVMADAFFVMPETVEQ